MNHLLVLQSKLLELRLVARCNDAPSAATGSFGGGRQLTSAELTKAVSNRRDKWESTTRPNSKLQREEQRVRDSAGCSRKGCGRGAAVEEPLGEGRGSGIGEELKKRPEAAAAAVEIVLHSSHVSCSSLRRASI